MPWALNGIIYSTELLSYMIIYTNYLGYKSDPISVRFMLSIVINISTISQNLFVSHDFTILLPSNGNQA